MNMSQWNVHPHDRRFVEEHLAKTPRAFNNFIRDRYNALHTTQGRRVANLSLLDLSEKVSKKQVRLASDDDAIRAKAKKEAYACMQIAAKAKGEDKALFHLADYIKPYGFELPETTTAKGVVARLKDEQWWRRKLRRLHGREVESTAIELNMVNKMNQIYVSDATVERTRGQRTRNRDLLESMNAVNELGESFTLQELVDFSISNPKNRRAELMVRIAGCEKIADDLGHVAEFYTLTCPSRMHASLSTSGERNPIYDGTTPLEAQRYLVKLWSLMRAALSHRDIKVYGIRVVEPHHDGTPHWHFLIFMEQKDKETVRDIMRRYALAVDGNELGAEKYRFKAVSIDKSKGTAAGYVAKYVSKNIDGYGLQEDSYGQEAKSSSERIVAYASTWGIRQFQQIGGPPVTVWRELRRASKDNLPEDDTMQEAFDAADKGDWASFVRLMGGPSVSRSNLPIKVLRLWSDKPGKYGEPIGNTVIGVMCGSEEVVTHVHTWKIEINTGVSTPQSTESTSSGTGTDLYDLSAGSGSDQFGTGRGACSYWSDTSSGTGSGVSLKLNLEAEKEAATQTYSPWSSVNNCT